MMSKLYYNNSHNRLGDEIQMTAVLKYYKSKIKDLRIVYTNGCIFLNSQEWFLTGLVDEWLPKGGAKPTDAGYLLEYNLWNWAPFLRKLGIYTELSTQYSARGRKHTVVYFPLLAPPYNPQRETQPKWSVELMKSLLDTYGNSVRMIVDKSKSDLIKPWVASLELPEDIVVYSSSFEESFGYVKMSKVMIAGDTGISHFGGAFKHPNMILLYGDQLEGKQRFVQQRIDMAKALGEPLLARDPSFNFDSRPCCNEKQFDSFYLFDNKYPINMILNTISKRLNSAG